MPSYGTFEQLYVETLNQQIELIAQMAQTAEQGSDEWKAGQFFLQGSIPIPAARLRRTGNAPDRADRFGDRCGLATPSFRQPQFSGIPDLFNISVSPDPDDSSTAVTIWPVQYWDCRMSPITRQHRRASRRPASL
ncbi:MAG: hypothetical protein R2848_17160 [Thermomicrobiales bacterium]